MALISLKLRSPTFMRVFTALLLVLLVSSTIVAYSILDRIHLLVLKIIEADTGQIDIVLNPIGSHINGSALDRALSPARLIPFSEVTVDSIVQVGNSSRPITLRFHELTREHQQGRGIFGQDLPPGSIYLSGSYPAKAGQLVRVDIPADRILSRFLPSFFANKTAEAMGNASRWLTSNYIEVDLQVHEVMDGPMSKFDQAATEFALVNLVGSLQILLKNFSPKEEQMRQFVDYCRGLDLKEVADRSFVNLADRYDVYSIPNVDRIVSKYYQFSEQILRGTGYFAVKTSSPIMSSMRDMRFFSMFLGMLLQVLVLALFLLSVIVVYNTKLIGVEQSNFEFGVLRTLGIAKFNVFYIILTNDASLIFTTFGVGYLIALVALKALSHIFYKILLVRLQLEATFLGVFAAVIIVAVVLPASSLLPAAQVHDKPILAALRPSAGLSGLRVQVELIGKSVPWGMVVFGGLASGVGIMIYFMLPLALVNLNLTLLLLIFIVLLSCLVAGVTLLAYHFEGLLERVLARLLLFWMKAVERGLVLKNMLLHREKSQRTSLMYSLSLGFIIMTLAGFNIEIEAASFQMLNSHGSHLQFTQLYSGQQRVRTNYSQKLATLAIKDQAIASIEGQARGYGYRTYTLNNLVRSRIELSNPGKTFSFGNVPVLSATPEYLTSVFSKDINIVAQSDDSLNPFEYLYTPKGLSTAIIGTYTAQMLNVGVGDVVVLNIFNSQNEYKSYEFKVSAIFSKCPGIRFGSNFLSRNSMVVSVPAMAELGTIRRLEEVSYDIAVVDLPPEQSEKAVLQVRSQTEIGAWTSDFTLKTLLKITDYVQWIILVVTSIFLCICLLSLVTSVTTSLLLQQKEIAILRAVGFTHGSVCRIYLAEAMVLVLTSCLIGTLVGCFLGYVLSVQQSIFTQVFLGFTISQATLLQILAIALGLAFISTYGPIRKITSTQIATVIRSK